MNLKNLILGASIVLIIGGGLFYIRNQSVHTIQTAQVNSTDVGTADSKTTDTLSRYSDYSEENLAQATANDGRAVLFFAALKWCHSCQAADKDIQNNFDKLPQNTTVLKVDYDTAKDLKQKYTITMQDTFVQVDGTGKEITRWNSGGEGIKSLLANLK